MDTFCGYVHIMDTLPGQEIIETNDGRSLSSGHSSLREVIQNITSLVANLRNTVIPSMSALLSVCAANGVMIEFNNVITTL